MTSARLGDVYARVDGNRGVRSVDASGGAKADSANRGARPPSRPPAHVNASTSRGWTKDKERVRILNVVPKDESGVYSADVVIIGSGMGGSTLAYALRDSNASVIVIERGGFLPQEDENWSPEAVFQKGRYHNAESWFAADGTRFNPGVYYYVGGNTKLFGAMLPRFREQDFGVVEHAEGLSPAWPISYKEIEPYYCQAEQLYGVRGGNGDPTDPWRSQNYPFPPLEHEPVIAELAASLRLQGLHPFSMPAAVDFGFGGGCIRCRTCDGFPCKINAKRDADICAMRPALESKNVSLLDHTRVMALVTSADGKSVTEAVADRDGAEIRVRGSRFIVASGAVNSAALLFRSRSALHPNGLANSSGMLGRNYMVHNSTFMVAVNPRRKNPTFFQKTLAFNDWYTSTESTPHPLGNVQMLGKLQTPMISSARPYVPKPILRWMTERSVDLYLTTEDLPTGSNRVLVDASDRIVVQWKPNNLSPHMTLAKRTAKVLRSAGYPLVFSERMGIATNSHQCGTAVMGEDPRASVLRPDCRSHDVENLWVSDSSSFPSSAAVNPALTIAANAFRIADQGEILR
jgi:choline dehydrogenase-like flavoprotein